MRHLFAEQMDYVFFCYGLAFMILATVCFTLCRRDRTELPWIWLGLFGLVHGLNEWLVMLTALEKEGPAIQAAKGIVLVLSFTFLVGFGRAALTGTGRRAATRRWIMVVLAGLCLLGGLAGWAGLQAAARYALAFPGAVAGAWLLWTAARRKDTPAGLWLRLAAVSLALYAVAAGLIVSYAGFPPACWVNRELFANLTGLPVELVRAAVAVCLAVAIYGYARVRGLEAVYVRRRAYWVSRWTAERCWRLWPG